MHGPQTAKNKRVFFVATAARSWVGVEAKKKKEKRKKEKTKKENVDVYVASTRSSRGCFTHGAHTPPPPGTTRFCRDCDSRYSRPVASSAADCSRGKVN